MVSYAAVVTNGHIRPMIGWLDLPDEVKADFDYLEARGDEDLTQTRFVQYRGEWYDVLDSQRITVHPSYTAYGFNVAPTHPLAGWAAINTESHWSGTCFRYMTQHEAYDKDLLDSWADYIIVGRYVA